MKILLLHPDDSIETGPWAAMHWDTVIDLGWSGRSCYERWSTLFGFPISSIYDVLAHDEHRRQMRDLLAAGLRRLMDSESVDWWDLYCSHPYHEFEKLILVSALAGNIPAHAQLVITRPHFISRALSSLLKCNIESFTIESPSGIWDRTQRFLEAAKALRPSKMAEIAFDKWDTDYRLRRHFAAAPSRSSTPLALLPSSYVNVTRAQVAYARMLPEQRFLLVVTRRNGVLPSLPANIEIRSLASYAPGHQSATSKELADLLVRWNTVSTDLDRSSSVLRLAKQLGVLSSFPDFLTRGLRVRDAWREVFAHEQISSVLSADEYNPYTRLPIVLANSRKIKTVFCDHGALNMSLGIRQTISDTYLMRGEMARDYSVDWCGLGAAKIVTGGPETTKILPTAIDREKDWIVFYSEAYELSSGRTRDLYAELLPRLCQLAAQSNRKVIVKLHPFESLRTRTALINCVAPIGLHNFIEIRSGPMTRDLFDRAWLSITVESSVAVESAMNGVPCFLCGWFDASWYAYGKQYAKYKAGYCLDSPEQISEIPQRLMHVQLDDAVRQKLETAISRDKLRDMLTGCD